MIFDKLYLFILKEFLEKKVTTTWDITKNFDWDNKPHFENKGQETRYFQTQFNLVKVRLKKMKEQGIMHENDVYVLDQNKAILSKHKFKSGIRNSVQILINNKWIIFEI